MKYLSLLNLYVTLKAFFKNKVTIFIIISLSMLLSSCANRVVSIPVPTDLLTKNRITKPLVENAITVTVRENQKISSVYKLEESIDAALKSALNYSNIFGHDSSGPFEVTVDVLEWYQSRADFGMFNCTIKTHYVLLDERKNIILEQEITTEASSDSWFFAGHKRSSRAATVNIAKNVNLFIDILKITLETRSSNVDKRELSDSDRNKNKIANDSSLSEELKNLSELHSSGTLTDDEFQKAKEKLLSK